MRSNEKLVLWLGSSKKDLMAFPIEVRKFFGHALDFAQHGDRHDAAKVLKGFGGAGVLELSKTTPVAPIARSTREVRGSDVCPALLPERRASTASQRRKRTWKSFGRDSRSPNCWQRICEMAKRSVDGVEIEPGSGNVFADLGLPDAHRLKIKSGLVMEITKATRKLGLTQVEAASRMGIPQPKVSAMLRGDFTTLSERKLMDCLNRLGYDIEIKVKPARASVGHLVLSVA